MANYQTTRITIFIYIYLYFKCVFRFIVEFKMEDLAANKNDNLIKIRFNIRAVFAMTKSSFWNNAMLLKIIIGDGNAKLDL